MNDETGRPTIHAAEIDQTLLSFCSDDWYKVARVIGKTMTAFEARRLRVSPDELDARMAALVGSGQLEAQGNIRNWRYSEVRLPTKMTDKAD